MERGMRWTSRDVRYTRVVQYARGVWVPCGKGILVCGVGVVLIEVRCSRVSRVWMEGLPSRRRRNSLHSRAVRYLAGMELEAVKQGTA